jgi:hypothetical protein
MKLYVIVRKDLTPSQQAVQAGHALAEYLLRGPWNSKWDNETLVYLGVENKFELEKLIYKFDNRSIKFVKFIEPDLNDEVTAIATEYDGSITSGLDLL